MPYKIDPTKCVSCGACCGVCPVGAINCAAGKYEIDTAACASCGMCAATCPMGAIVAVPLAGVSVGADAAAKEAKVVQMTPDAADDVKKAA